jgi:hypothetical protein
MAQLRDRLLGKRLCKYARQPKGCYQTNQKHKDDFAHPGDFGWDAEPEPEPELEPEPEPELEPEPEH